MVRSGIESWGKPLTKKLPDLKALGYPLVDTAKGKCYEFFSRLVLTVEGANIEVRWEVARPGLEPYDGTFPSSAYSFLLMEILTLMFA